MAGMGKCAGPLLIVTIGIACVVWQMPAFFHDLLRIFSVYQGQERHGLDHRVRPEHDVAVLACFFPCALRGFRLTQRALGWPTL